MEQKIKIIAIALGAVVLISIFFAISYVNKYNSLNREYEELTKKYQNLQQQNKELTQKVASTQEELSGLKDREEAMKTEIEHLSSARDDLRKRYDALLEEKEKLMERVKSSGIGSTIPVVSAGAAASTASGDEYWAGILKEKENLELQLAYLKDSIKNNQIKMDELGHEKTSLDLEVQRLTKEKADIQRQLEYNEKMADSLSLQLVREKDDKRKVITQANLFKEENYALRSRVKDLMGAKVSLEKKLKGTEDKRIELVNRLNQMDELLQEKLSEILDTKQDIGDIKKGLAPSSGSSVELPPILVPGSSEAGAQSAVKEAPPLPLAAPGAEISTQSHSGGKVISINEENNFVILDIGENQGMYQGQILYVYRGQQQIASLEVVEVRANVCAADIKEKAAYLKIGDMVK